MIWGNGSFDLFDLLIWETIDLIVILKDEVDYVVASMVAMFS